MSERKKLIVLIDDEEETLHLTAFVLRDAGFSIVGFTNGAEALKFLNKTPEKVAAVVSDLSLTVLDGLTIVEQIRLNEQTFQREPVPLAFYTAYDQSPGGATERVAQKCGVEKIWHKPQDTPHLGDYLRDWLDNREADSKVRENYVL